MNLSIKKINQAIASFLISLLFFTSAAQAESLIIPGFMGIESSYIEASDVDTANAYFTLVNLHYEPLLLLGIKTELAENVTFYDSNNEVLEYVEVLPGERLVMRPGGIHAELTAIESSIAAGEAIELTLHTRRGREAMEYVEEFFDNSMRETKGGGIPNEDEYVMHVTARNQ